MVDDQIGILYVDDGRGSHRGIVRCLYISQRNGSATTTRNGDDRRRSHVAVFVYSGGCVDRTACETRLSVHGERNGNGRNCAACGNRDVSGVCDPISREAVVRLAAESKDPRFVFVIYETVSAGDGCRKYRRIVQRDLLNRITQVFSQDTLTSFRQSTAASASEILRTAVRILDEIRGVSLGSDILLHFVGESALTRLNRGGLNILRSLTTGIHEFRTKLCDGIVLRINLVLTKLILDGLRVRIDRVDDVSADVVGVLSVRAVFRDDRAVQIRRRKSVLTATVRKLRLEREVLVHVCHLPGIRRDLRLSESVLDSLTESADRILECADTFPSVLRLIQPRIQDIAGRAAVALTVAVTAPSVPKNKKQKNQPPTGGISPTETALLIVIVRHTLISFVQKIYGQTCRPFMIILT